MAPVRLGLILRELNPAHSWVVSADTEEPSGYHPAQLDPALHRNPHVIREAVELKQWFDARTS